MSVHKELAQHAEKQNQLYQQFLQLDQIRESYIEEAVELCKQGKAFSTDKINEVTNHMNRMNIRFVPFRKNVTTEMIQDYVKTLK
jgi:cell division FtsZ-interacting protein ZapD